MIIIKIIIIILHDYISDVLIYKDYNNNCYYKIAKAA